MVGSRLGGSHLASVMFGIGFEKVRFGHFRFVFRVATTFGDGTGDGRGEWNGSLIRIWNGNREGMDILHNFLQKLRGWRHLGVRRKT